ncbi:hypothetical protein DITRI_Ditri18aG0106100 [Diplodiscus trichospermus]
MIKAVIVMNTQGKPRLAKFYEYLPVEKQQELVRSVFSVLCNRAENVSNFIEAESIFGPDSRLVYKHFATLYFVFVFDSSENELAVLDLIQVFVETLDKCFKNVCELDIVFNYSKIHTILDEIIFGGQVLETSSAEVLKAVEEISKFSLSLSLSRVCTRMSMYNYACIHTSFAALQHIFILTNRWNLNHDMYRLEAASNAITLIPKSASGWRSR